MTHLESRNELTTARLRLRPVQEHDVQAVFEIYGDPRTQVHNPAGPLSNIESAASMVRKWLAHWDKHSFGQWALRFNATPNEVIGFVGVTYRMYGEVERLNLGYRLKPDVWGRGIATEVATRATRFAFVELGQPELFALVRPSNLDSIRVLEKLGMLLHGTLADPAHNSLSLMYRGARDAQPFVPGLPT